MNITATIDIKRPTREVFDFVMEVPHDTQWRTGVAEAAFTSDEPLGVGTTGFDRIEANGREMVSTWTVFDYEPGVLARWKLDSGPIQGTGGYICEAAGDGTRFTLEAIVKPTGWYRLMGPVFGMIGRKQNQADVHKLKTILEAQAEDPRP
jgi:hypothetical protein